MEKDLDKKLYNDYLKGEKEAFELLYKKYKSKIEYFIYNIVKDYQKAEDLTQETFIYVMQNKMKENCSFKYFIYLVAKSKAFNYINVEERRNEIAQIYLNNSSEEIERDVLELITKEENQKEVLEAIELLDERYKNAIYLVNIEGLTYKETSEILGETLPNIKNLIHRGKMQLRKILLKKGFDEMNKVSKVLVMVIAISVALSGIVYATSVIYKKFNTNHNITMNPTYQSTLDEKTINNLWVGTFDLAWKELSEKIGKKIELEENVEIANQLNESTFSKEMLDPNDYEIVVEELRIPIGYKIDATLNKKLNFLEVFDNFSNDFKWTFGDSEEYIKYFGINDTTSEEINKNVEVLFYNKSVYNDFAVKLKTKEGDQIILYRTDDKKSFNEYYEDIKTKTNAYTGNKEFSEFDEILVPYVKVNGMISYNELLGKTIKDTNGLFIREAIQNINFSLNEKGCNLSSRATLVAVAEGEKNGKYFYFNDTFVIFMKEANIDNPYFALKVDNADILEKKDEINETRIVDYTMIDSERYKAIDGECKFFENESYEYYFTTRKIPFVQVYFENGESDSVEWALKNGKISIDLLDKYGVEYIKKEK